jgi:hypothetical protein
LSSVLQLHTRLAILADRNQIDLLGIKGESIYADAVMKALRFTSSHEWEIDAPPHAVRFGVAWDRYWSEVDWQSDTDAAPSLNPTPESLRIDDHLTYRAFYLEDIIALERKWFLSAGARLEDATGASPLQVSPRLALRGELPGSFRFRVGTGQFLQYPDGAQSFSRETYLAIESLSELPPERATLVGLALGRDWGRFGCDVEMYTRDTRDLLLPEDRETYTARATGRAYAKGLETELRLNPLPRDGHIRSWYERLELHLSHAWSKSHFKGEVYESWTPVATDREHSFLGRLRVPISSSVRFSCVLRLASGSPYTPLLGRVAWWDTTNQVHYRGIWGDPYSARASAYGRLDLRLDREVQLFGRRGRLFLEILNVTNRANTLSTVWDEDLEKRSPVRGLPLLPFIGLSM